MSHLVTVLLNDFRNRVSLALDSCSAVRQSQCRKYPSTMNCTRENFILSGRGQTQNRKYTASEGETECVVRYLDSTGFRGDKRLCSRGIDSLVVLETGLRALNF